jgi:hypothetical protein
MPTRVHRQDLIVKSRPARLILLNDLRREFAIAVAGVSSSISPKSPRTVFQHRFGDLLQNPLNLFRLPPLL